jgi:hypothetical protein
VSRRSSLELLEYTRLTLQLIELHQHREEDAHLASELKLALKRYIVELEQEASNPLHSRHTFDSPEPTSE